MLKDKKAPPAPLPNDQQAAFQILREEFLEQGYTPRQAAKAAKEFFQKKAA